MAAPRRLPQPAQTPPESRHRGPGSPGHHLKRETGTGSQAGQEPYEALTPPSSSHSRKTALSEDSPKSQVTTGRLDRYRPTLLDVLAALSRVTPTDGMRVLPVLPDEPPFDRRQSFEESLAELVELRVQTFREPLSSRISDLDAVVAAVTSCLTGSDPASPRLLHGDLIPANIFVNAEGQPAAVLDFGFLTTVGDPSFDAAIAASICDMYGSRAAINEAILTEAVIDRFGYEERRLWVYRAAYALSTCNCFSASGSDGHFHWCLNMLARPQVRDAIAL